MYPIKFEPIYQERIWGGRRLEDLFQRQLPAGKIGESWDLSGHGLAVSRISNGSFKGKSLTEIIEQQGHALLGASNVPGETFPLLIKIIDANDRLSIQVHPGDGVDGNGKTEAWYIVDAKPNAQIIYGLKPSIDKSRFKQMISQGEMIEGLNYIDVKKGDLVFVPAGTVHALLAGVVVYEVQQSSDITYRLYDYDRVTANGDKREVHLNLALGVMDFASSLDYDFRQAIHCPYFSVDIIQCGKAQTIWTHNQFLILCATEGHGVIYYEGGQECIRAGETVLIPACLGEIDVSGKMDVLLIR